MMTEDLTSITFIHDFFKWPGQAPRETARWKTLLPFAAQPVKLIKAGKTSAIFTVVELLP